MEATSKIYLQNNYVIVEDAESGFQKMGAAKDVRIVPQTIDSDDESKSTFSIKGLVGYESGVEIAFGDVQNGDGEAYDDVPAFLQWSTANTGKSEAGATAITLPIQKIAGGNLFVEENDSFIATMYSNVEDAEFTLKLAEKESPLAAIITLQNNQVGLSFTNDVGILTALTISNGGQIVINCADPESTGITANQDFTGKAGGFSFIQKMYVDKENTAIKNINADYVMTGDDNTIIATGTFSVTLPPLDERPGKPFTIVNRGSGDITVLGNVNGSSERTLTTNKHLTVKSDGTQYYIVAIN